MIAMKKAIMLLIAVAMAAVLQAQVALADPVQEESDSDLPADYSAVEAALAKVPEDLSIYTDETVAALQAAIDAVVEGLTINHQEEVDAMADAIEAAVAALKETPPPPPPPPPAGKTTVIWNRIAGSNRYGTAKELVLKEFPGGAREVILVSGANFPDALAATGYAASLNGGAGGPILITKTETLPSQTKEALKALKAEKVTIIGGEPAVGAAVEKTLKSGMGMSVDRIYGSNRYNTAQEVYKAGKARGGWGNTAVISTGLNFADALSISPYLYAARAPLFLTEKSGGLKSASKKALLADTSITKVVLVGGENVVSKNLENDLKKAGKAVIRLAGKNRYATSHEIGEWLTDRSGQAFAAGVDFTYDGASFATGVDFPDALTGGILQGVRRAPLYLVKTSVSSNLMSTIKVMAKTDGHISVFGGEPAVSEAVRKTITGAWGKAENSNWG